MTDTHNTEDIFGDGSCIVFAQFNDNLDTTGTPFTVVGNSPVYMDGIWDRMIDHTDSNTSDEIFSTVQYDGRIVLCGHTVGWFMVEINGNYYGYDGSNSVNAIIDAHDKNVDVYVNGFLYRTDDIGEDISGDIKYWVEYKDYTSVDQLRIFDRELSFEERMTLVGEIDGGSSSIPKTKVDYPLTNDSEPKTKVDYPLTNDSETETGVNLPFLNLTKTETDVCGALSIQTKSTRTEVDNYRVARIIK